MAAKQVLFRAAASVLLLTEATMTEKPERAAKAEMQAPEM